MSKKSEYNLDKILDEEENNLLTNYALTILNNKKGVIQNLSEDNLDITVSSGNGRMKKILQELTIDNHSFDPTTYSKNNIEQFKEVKYLIDPLEEEGIVPKNFYEKIEFNFVPKLEKGLKIELKNLQLYTFKEKEEVKNLDNNYFDLNNKKLFCIYTNKLNKNEEEEENEKSKRPKFKKIKNLANAIDKEDKEFFKYFKSVMIIFEVKDYENIEEYYDKINWDIRDFNEENENFDVIFNIYDKNNGDSPSEIFYKAESDKTFYFILNDKNYIEQVGSLSHDPEHFVKNLCSKESNSIQVNNEGNMMDKKIESFFNFYEFLKNINKLNYRFYLNYNFNLILNISPNEENLIIKDINFTRFSATFRHNELEKMRNWCSFLKPERSEFEEVETIQIDIDFNDMICKKCEKEIKDPDLFYCYICKDKYCYDCVKTNFRENKGKKKFIDPQHNLLLFKTRNKDDLIVDKEKLGKNLFAKAEEEDLSRYTSAKCNGCGLQFATSPRYICISCYPGYLGSGDFNDFCQNCIEHMMKDDEKGKHIQSYKYNLNQQLNFFLLKECTFYHEHNRHIYLMVALANNNVNNPYFDY
jgi:hypothetical protein